MTVLSIDELKKNISDHRSKAAFDEVLSCFYSKNYRSAVVMLYNVVISDLYYKIYDLSNIYIDSGAVQIKNEIDNEFKNNPASPNWEKKIVEDCYSKNKIIDNVSKAHIEDLRNERNLCAHPSMVSDDLYRPLESKVFSLIHTMLIDVLCKPSFMSKILFETILNDIDKVKSNFADIADLTLYISSKYLDKINNEKEEYPIFRSLWKLTFKCDDEKSEENREQNFFLLSEIYKRNKVYTNNQISKESEYFSSNINLSDKSCAYKLVLFLNKDFGIYKSLTKDTRIAIKSFVGKSNDIKSIALFLCDDIKKSADTYAELGMYNVRNALYIADIIKDKYGEIFKYDFIVKVYGKSENYDDADYKFEKLIEPSFKMFSKDQFIQLLENWNDNSQIHARHRSMRDFSIIKNHIMKLYKDFDFAPYKNIKST